MVRRPRPATEAELRAMVEAAFRELTGHAVSHEEPVYVEKYGHGGMSSGYVSPEFWRETAIPLLVRRLSESAGAIPHPLAPQERP